LYDFKEKDWHQTQIRAAMVEQASTFAALVLGLSLVTPSTPNITARIFKWRNLNLADYFPGIL
jgi:lambda repressor-like predicted transcriptional regulator